MAVIDLIAKWLLEKIDKKLFKKKKFSVQERMKILHHFLDDLKIGSERCAKYLDGTIPKGDHTKSLSMEELKRLFIENDLPGIWIEHLEEIEKEVVKSSHGNIGEHVDELGFFFDRDGFPELGKQILEVVSYIGLNFAESKSDLSKLKDAIEVCDKKEVNGIYSRLANLADSLNNQASEVGLIKQEFLEFAQQFKE